jgi:hypothetical protein
MMGYRGPIDRAVATAINAQSADARDVATVALARRYAILIDEATVASKYRDPLDQLAAALRLLAAVAMDSSALVDQAERALSKVTDALAAHTVASDLGPKLLAALTALGLTPAARGEAKGGDRGDAAPAGGSRPESEFERQRRERAERRRQHGA